MSYPEEREYVVGPSGFSMSRDGADYYYEPGARVWLVRAPLAADLKPTGEARRYETKVTTAGEPVLTVPRRRGRPRKHG